MPILDWLNKDQAVTATQKSTYRLLEEVPALSYGDSANENLLIQGDNLEALKALLPFYAGKVKCVYIDPPYNTGSAFEHYNDNLEHSLWLSLMYPRLELLWQLLADKGSIWISCDDRQSHYLKVMCDEIFGRNNFVASNVWQKRYSRENREAIGDVHEYLFVYAKKPLLFRKFRNKIPLTEEQTKIYKNPNNDPRGRWRRVPMTAQAGHATAEQFYPITTPAGKIHFPPEGRCWGLAEATFKRLLSEGKIDFGKKGDSQPSTIRYLSDVEGITPWTWWPNTEVGHTGESKREIHAIFGKKDAFDTPKPERLIERILHIASNPNDLVLDSFLGSGTTAAVAHKMQRRYIGIELGEHAQTHCQTRLKKVIEGEQGGISKAANWQGGGGFRFFKLGATVFDESGSLNANIKFSTLAAYLWYLEHQIPLQGQANSPLIGVYNGTAYYLLYNSNLSDRRPASGNALTSALLNALPEIENQEKIVIYGVSCRLGAARLAAANITFKNIPIKIDTP